ncbi:molybdenum cofactor guanylyltransferase [Niallia circulans]|uniref:Probable molybdenum cofactor guanylyltransferase n=1 Tax=Niallia circulans TaxID=1397 RepID=A0A941GJE3_NIACI|nr:molybdenum cofactor guanylyltransferase [Niallia circulans]MCB5239109.1 molybdenum cofactor guanylyltransferase [Niallia circulans]
MKIAGIVLAGGKSSRYGKPKMFETYQGKYFYQHSVEALKQNSLSPIVIATNENLISSFEQDNVDFIVEKESETYQGPLFAIYNALSKISNVEWYFVLSCDTPFITPTFVDKMIQLAKNSYYDAIVPVQAGHIHPLLALYHQRSLVKMEQLLAKDKRKMQLLLDEISVLTVSFPAEDKMFININRPTDWHKRQEKN